jgi:predicted TIM-barrel fold metal-dependent hydrolase
MLIDSHVHLGKDYYKTGYSLSKEELLKKMDKFQIDKSIIFSCPNVFPFDKNPYEKENQFIINSAHTEPRLIPFMFVHPWKDTIEYIHSNQNFFKGFKIACNARNMEYCYDDLFNNPVMNLISSMGKPLIVHIGLKERQRAKNLVQLLKRYKSKVVLAHSARLFSYDLDLISKFPNVYLDLSPLNVLISCNNFLPPASELPRIIKDKKPAEIINYLSSLFEKRLIWGTDTPWCDNLCLEGYEKEVKLYRELNLENSCSNLL